MGADSMFHTPFHAALDTPLHNPSDAPSHTVVDEPSPAAGLFRRPTALPERWGEAKRPARMKRVVDRRLGGAVQSTIHLRHTGLAQRSPEVPMSTLPPSAASPAERAEFERLLGGHRHRLVAVVSRRLDASLSARLDPEGMVNDAYLRAWERWSEVRGRPGFSTFPWLYQLVRDCPVVPLAYLEDHVNEPGAGYTRP
jgi:hypothetical protein